MGTGLPPEAADSRPGGRDGAPPAEVTLLCDRRGRILDQAGGRAVLAAGPGDTLAALVAEESAGRAFDLLLALQRRQGVFGWPLEVRAAGGGSRTLLLAGVAGGSGLLLAGVLQGGGRPALARRRLAALCRRLAAEEGARGGFAADREAREGLRCLVEDEPEAAAGGGGEARTAARARLVRRLARRLAAAGLGGEPGRLAAALDEHARRLAAALRER